MRYTCHRCGKEFSHLCRLTRHQQRKTPCAQANDYHSKFSCKYCGKSLASQPSKSRHENHHCPQRPIMNPEHNNDPALRDTNPKRAQDKQTNTPIDWGSFLLYPEMAEQVQTLQKEDQGWPLVGHVKRPLLVHLGYDGVGHSYRLCVRRDALTPLSLPH